MNPNVVLMVVRGLAQLFGLQGKSKEANALTLLADSIKAGRNVDAKMMLVATALESGAAPDWDAVVAKLNQPL